MKTTLTWTLFDGSPSFPPPPLPPSLPQLSAWWFLTFTASEIKERVQYLTGVQYLYDTINPDQIEIPQFVFDHDREVCISCAGDVCIKIGHKLGI